MENLWKMQKITKDLNDVAKSIVDIVNTEAMVNVRVAYGIIVSEIRDVSKFL